jgi:D-glycero-beta-D-manno-heptose-7-phosphate kinase
MKRFEAVNILVVGDIMLDRYVVGEVDRISPEAPVPIVHVHEEYSTLGGCGNVVRNIRSLGANVTCLASIANDTAGKEVLKELSELEVNSKVITASPVTIVKERIVAGERKTQMLRVDREVPLGIDPERAIEAIQGLDTIFDVVVVSDYSKGLISSELMDYLREKYKKIIVDPKPSNSYTYGRVFLMTPNTKEWHTLIANTPWKVQADYFLVTKGKEGMELVEAKDPDRNNWTICDIPTKPVEVFNVTGAGDTAVAVLSVCHSAGYSLLDSAIIANECAGWVVTQSGTTAISKEVFESVLKNYKLTSLISINN